MRCEPRRLGRPLVGMHFELLGCWAVALLRLDHEPVRTGCQPDVGLARCRRIGGDRRPVRTEDRRVPEQTPRLGGRHHDAGRPGKRLGEAEYQEPGNRDGKDRRDPALTLLHTLLSAGAGGITAVLDVPFSVRCVRYRDPAFCAGACCRRRSSASDPDRNHFRGPMRLIARNADGSVKVGAASVTS
jgi:hypothetical protein